MRIEEFTPELSLSALILFKSPEKTRTNINCYSMVHTLAEAISYFMPEYVTKYKGTIRMLPDNFMFHLIRERQAELRQTGRVIKNSFISIDRSGSQPFLKFTSLTKGTEYHSGPSKKWLRSRGF